MSLTGNVKSNYRLNGKLSKLETVHGRSAYEIAVINGYEGTESEWLESLHGDSGYEIAKQHGYIGTENDFVRDLTNFAPLANEAKAAEQKAKAYAANASASAVSAANDAAVAQNAKTAAESANAAAQQSEINAAKSETAAKKYADQASSAASGGVTSFHGRGGHVMPQSGDYTAAQVGAVPTARKVNGKALSSDISLTASDVGARPNTWMPTAADVGALPIGGGKLTSNLQIDSSIPMVILTDPNYPDAIGDVRIHGTGVRVTNQNKNGLFNALVVSSPDSTPEEALKLLYQDKALYNIYHTANKPTAADVGAVALNGSNAMTGNLLLEKAGGISTVLYDSTANSEGRVAIWDQTMAFLIRDNKGTAQLERSIHLKGYTDTNSIADALVLQNKYYGVTNDYPILHTGNKPSGSYTGNGSSAAWTLNIGGIGELLLIRSAAASRDYIVGKYGAVCIGGSTPTTFSREEIRFESGTLTVATSSGAFNQNGSTYTYHRL